MPLAGALRALKRLARPLKPYLRGHGARAYGQFGEDLLVFNALMPGRRGFYVDVGAYDPVEASNTYKLYRHGWRGITIEPNPQAAWRFRLLRPRDTHLAVGVSRAPATLRYHRFDIGMLNTMDEARAEALAAEGYRTRGTADIRCDRLETLLDEHAPGRHIDLLNVDCEGDDLGVLDSIDYVRWRPTVVLMEDLEGHYAGARSGEGSAAMRFMQQRGYAPIARLVFTLVFVARDWRELNKRSGAFREAAIYPGLLPEAGDAPAAIGA